MGKSYNGPKEVIAYIKEHDIQFVDLKFVDLFGMLQHLTLPASNVNYDTFEKGMGFDGSSIKGFQTIDESDMILKPDSESMFKDPFFEESSISVFCDIIDPNGHKLYHKDPRGIAKKAEQYMISSGIADVAFYGPELEFFIFDEVRFDQSTQHGYYFLNSDAAFWNTGKEGGKNMGHRVSQKAAYLAAPPNDQYNNLRSKISQTLDFVGLETELHHHEVGAAGQSEIGFKFGPLMTQADKSTIYKYVVKNVVDRYGKTATFMPKPLLQENGSGMHMNISLMKNGKNLFYETGGYADLSQLAIHFIGGILKHASSLCAIVCPTTNSYRRLVPGYEAPMNLVYSARNRSACIRIPMMASGPKSKRIEFRTPDPSCNPYLGFSAVLMAGLDGVQNKIIPDDPIDVNMYEIEKAGGLKRTPSSLEEAIDALENDHDYLLKGEVFSKEFIETWIRLKRKDEIEYIKLRPHPSEFSLYFNI
jgi:glutamine synthetase